MSLPPTFCITLHQTPAREAWVRAHLTGRGFTDVRYFYGVHGPSWGLETGKWYHRNGEGYKIPRGHVGLVLSHWILWHLIEQAGIEEALVVEDDVHFVDPQFTDRYAEARRELPADWQLWYVGTVGTEYRRQRQITPRICTCDAPMGTHCYLVRRTALPVLIASNQEARAHIDIQMIENSLPHLRYYVAWPNLARQLSADGHTRGVCGNEWNEEWRR